MIEIGQVVYIIREGYPEHLVLEAPCVKAAAVNISSQVVSSDKTEYILGGDFREFVQEEDIYTTEAAALNAARHKFVSALDAIESSAEKMRAEISAIDCRLEMLKACQAQNTSQ